LKTVRTTNNQVM